ncbi:MAG: hypothetical protein OXM55_05130 [Bdellovibrionales bacterium]|nr:hypothetical protein [Bdellovibrionales bacterium]
MLKKIGLYFLMSYSFFILSGCDDSKDKELKAALEKNKELEEELLALARTEEEEGKANPPAVSVCDRTKELQDIILFKVKKTDCKAVTDKDLAAIKTIMEYHYVNKRSLPILKKGDFSGFTSLVSLYIDFNPSVKTVSADFLQTSDLSSLKEIWLIGGVNSVSPNLLSSLSSLESVQLDFYNVIRLPSGLLSGLTNLQSISIYYQKVFFKGFFSSLPALHTIYISKGVSDETNKRIQEEVGPDVQIHRVW